MSSSELPALRRGLAIPERLSLALHFKMILLFAGGLVLVAAATLALLSRAAHDPARTGALLAWYPPPQWSAETRLRSAGAHGRIRSEGRFTGLIEVVSDEPGLAARLERSGAVLVMVPLPWDALTFGACHGTSVLPRQAGRTSPPLPM